MSNRVEELESKVSELQAAVDGLTEELVETRARLAALEDEVEPETAAPDGDPDPAPATEEVDPTAETADGAEKHTPDEETEGASEDGESETTDDGDIIVA
jgi:peptidoglycan hydrolase CwlO-like protein